MKSNTGKLEHNGKMAQNLDICTLLYHPEQRKVSPRNIATQLFQDNKNFTLPAELFCLLLDFSRERLCMNCVRTFLRMCDMLIGYSFEPRPNNHALAIEGSVMTIGLSIN